MKVFEKIIAETPKSKNGQGYTEKDLKAFDNIVSSKDKKPKNLKLKLRISQVKFMIHLNFYLLVINICL